MSSGIAQQHEEIIQIANLTKTYKSSGSEVSAIDNVFLSIKKGEFIIIKGPSGSGKTTLLHLMAGITDPSRECTLKVNGVDLLNRSEDYLATFRARNIGFVLQFYGLLSTMTVLENIEIAGYFAGTTNYQLKAREILMQVGLANKYDRFPHQLSGGERQRVAIARALVNSPPILLCDEPTGNLDYNNSRQIFDLLKKTNQKEHTTVVLVTHNDNFLNYATRVVELVDGKIPVNDVSPITDTGGVAGY